MNKLCGLPSIILGAILTLVLVTAYNVVFDEPRTIKVIFSNAADDCEPKDEHEIVVKGLRWKDGKLKPTCDRHYRDMSKLLCPEPSRVDCGRPVSVD